MDKVRIGIIGTGRIGRVHATSIVRHVSGAMVVAVADPFVDQASEWLDALGIAGRHHDYHALLARNDVDAVYVCSSTDTHAQIVIDAAAAGKHIFCEKPIDLSVEKVRAALAAVETAGVALQIGFNRRFDHNFAQVQDGVRQGKIGDIHLVKITSRDPEPPPVAYVAVSGGLFLDMMIHDFDMARFLSGSEVIAVQAAGAVLIDPAIGAAGDVDTAIVTLRFANGALGVIDNSRKAVYGYDQRIEVFGSKGVLIAENDTPTTVRYLGVEGETRDKPLWFFLERYARAFEAESQAFVAAVSEGRTPPVVGRDGLEPIFIGLAANKSLRERREVSIVEVQS